MFQVLSNPFAVTLISFALSAVLTYLVREYARKNGFVAAPKSDRWHKKPTAMMGGAAVFLTTIIVYLLFVPHTKASWIILGGSSIFNNGQTITSLNQVIGQVNQINGNLPEIPLVPVTALPGVPDSLTGGFFSSLGNLFALRYPTYRAGVQFNLPFSSRTAKAQLGRSLVEGQRVNTQREQIEQSVQVDVRNALQLLRTSQARLRSAAIARDNSEKQYASEQRKLDAGQSTVFLVLERQTALTNARGNELRAQTELNKAIADLQRATGNSLRANNIVANLK